MTTRANRECKRGPAFGEGEEKLAIVGEIERERDDGIGWGGLIQGDGKEID